MVATYKTANRTILAIFAILAAAVAAAVAAGVATCPSRALFGRECILCGCTRDFLSMMRLEFRFINPISPWLACSLAAELPYRAVFSFAHAPRALCAADAALHAIAAAAFLAANFSILFSG